jgi:hypothetical protein
LRKISVNPNTLAVAFTQVLPFVPSKTVVNVKSVAYASIGSSSVITSSNVGDIVTLLADLHGKSFPREPSDVLYLPTDGYGGLQYLGMDRPEFVDPGCIGVAATRDTQMMLCLHVAASINVHRILKISMVDNFPTTSVLAGASAGTPTKL